MNKENHPSRRKSPLYLMLRKFIWGPGPTVPVSFTGGMSVRVGYGDEEVRSGVPIGQLTTKVGERG